MLGVIGGVGFFDTIAFKGVEFREIKTPHGTAHLLEKDGIAFIPRHGPEARIPPHRINHRANIYAFKEKDISSVIGMNSTGSLKRNISPPAILIPHDFINIWNVATFHDNEIVHIVPGLDERFRNKLISLSGKFQSKIIPEGIYVQTTGPRLETKAEVIMLSNFADVVGMTMASEATLARELGIAYASICSIDNYAHGIVDEPLTNQAILENARLNAESIREFIFKVSGELE